MFQAFMEILLILVFLACLAIIAAIPIEGWRRLVRGATLGRGFWVSLVGGTGLLSLVLAVLILIGALTLGVGA